MAEKRKEIVAKPLTPDGYLPFGHVLSVRENDPALATAANQGTAARFNWLATLENLRPNSARTNMCVFRCQPRQLPFDVKLLERHEFSTQFFIPMNAKKRYLVIVAKGGIEPDLSTLEAFVASNIQGIGYYPGTWHHPMIALDDVTDFVCIVHEDGSPRDCEVVQLDSTIRCLVPQTSSL